ncbi:hypothetical protein VTG60DRAFT_3866 [Thermothelomyces hinnuleus]
MEFSHNRFHHEIARVQGYSHRRNLRQYSYYSRPLDQMDVIYRQVTSVHAWPQEWITDRDTKFVSKFWQALIQCLGVNSKLSTAYHPQTDRQTERLNQVVEQYLRSYVNYQQND